jgi:hypothetical protein
MMKPRLLIALAATALAGCAQGNLRTPASYAALAPPTIHNPWYDPNAPYGRPTLPGGPPSTICSKPS